jgi:hypothetical protein
MVLTLLTMVLYAPAIQYKHKDWRVIFSLPMAWCTLCLDVIANYTEISYVLGWPKKGEYTMSKRFKRIMTDETEPEQRRKLAQAIYVYLDGCEPDGKH